MIFTLKGTASFWDPDWAVRPDIETHEVTPSRRERLDSRNRLTEENCCLFDTIIELNCFVPLDGKRRLFF